MTGCQFASYNGLHTHGGKLPGYERSVDASFHRRTQRALHSVDSSSAGRRIAATMMPVGVPRVPYKGKFRNWQWVDIWNCLYRDRIIFMSDALNDELGNQLVATMLYLDSENKKDISIYMNVEGGDVVPSLAMHDTFKHIKSDVATIGFGGVMGMAGFLLACGALPGCPTAGCIRYIQCSAMGHSGAPACRYEPASIKFFPCEHSVKRVHEALKKRFHTQCCERTGCCREARQALCATAHEHHAAPPVWHGAGPGGRCAQRGAGAAAPS